MGLNSTLDTMDPPDPLSELLRDKDVSPVEPEVACDGVDNNCDGIEESMASCIHDGNELDDKDGTP